MDNARSFRSSVMRNFLSSWGVSPVYRCAYCPSGNGIVERHHRTVKRMAARASTDPCDMVFYYNATPREVMCGESLPSQRLFRNKWRVPGEDSDLRDVEQVSREGFRSKRWRPGERVFVKPPSARCTVPWPLGVVTGAGSERSVEVNGVPRHVADVRPVSGEKQCDAQLVERPKRSSKRPDYFGNNIYDT